MENVFTFILAVFMFFFGLYVFINPVKFQERELKRLEFYAFLLNFKWTGRYYNKLLERRSSEEYLKQIKYTSLILIFFSILLFSVLLLKFYDSFA
ncbi:hypothetical protein [Flavobacterium sp. AJR]|uniref:hypothetical protein n=1 Tax=Flavobacterium sp. AJR TaxID=1979369 RepID=UPI000A3D764E|nr:hypothetical protein [Flavobacterium sp. AJR]OUL62756.1 hypothetical protein B8T70_08520 [Flavobacterium sp. AJR]